MLRRRLIIIICVLLSLMPLVMVRASYELDVPWYSTPKINGRIEQNEYPPTAVSIRWSQTTSCKVYVCQNSSYLFIAVDIPDETNQPNDGITIWLGKEPPSPERTPRMDDYKIKATRNGQWSVDRLKITNASTTDASGWRVEVAVSFSELGITKGRAKAIAFVIEDAGIVRTRWPEYAQEGSPKTWGTLYSTYSWGTIELLLQSMTINPRAPVVGQNVTITIGYGNDGTSPVENVTIGFFVDDSPIKIFNDTRRIDPHGYLNVAVTWRATYGNHTISVKLDPYNRIFERERNNNNATISVFARMARLTVKAKQGVNITVGEQTKNVNASRKVVFDVSLGRVNLTAQNVLYKGETRYVFQSWSNGENSSTIVLTIDEDREIDAFYKTEHRLRMIFKDSKGSKKDLQPSRVILSAANGSIIALNYTYDIWLQEGTVIISNIIWSGVNVKPDNTTYRVQCPANLTIHCRIYDVVVNVRDSFDFPIQGANVTLLLPNQTLVWRATDNEGKASFIGIPVGRIDGRVSNLGITTPIGEREITTDYTISISMPLSTNTILILVAASAGIISTFLVIWLKRGARKQRVPEPLRSLGPPV